MYIPAPFRADDAAELHDLIDANSFGLLVIAGEAEPVAAHLPFVLDREEGRLLGHVARANPIWREITDRPVLCVFQGVHGYISPSWYVSQGQVPTWNYQAVHAYGRASLMDDAALHDFLGRLTRDNEARRNSGWSDDTLSDELYRRMRKAVVGFSIAIERLEGKAKLSQNKSEPDRQAVMSALAVTGDAADNDLATAMRGGSAP